jgi:hypothetical protein
LRRRANHHAASVEYCAFELGNSVSTFARESPGDALGVDPCRSGESGGRDQVARSLAADAVVARGQRADVVRVVGQIGQLVHYGCRRKIGDRVV